MKTFSSSWWDRELLRFGAVWKILNFPRLHYDAREEKSFLCCENVQTEWVERERVWGSRTFHLFTWDIKITCWLIGEKSLKENCIILSPHAFHRIFPYIFLRSLTRLFFHTGLTVCENYVKRRNVEKHVNRLTWSQVSTNCVASSLFSLFQVCFQQHTFPAFSRKRR